MGGLFRVTYLIPAPLVPDSYVNVVNIPFWVISVHLLDLIMHLAFTTILVGSEMGTLEKHQGLT